MLYLLQFKDKIVKKNTNDTFPRRYIYTNNIINETKIAKQINQQYFL